MQYYTSTEVEASLYKDESHCNDNTTMYMKPNQSMPMQKHNFFQTQNHMGHDKYGGFKNGGHDMYDGFKNGGHQGHNGQYSESFYEKEQHQHQQDAWKVTNDHSPHGMNGGYGGGTHQGGYGGGAHLGGYGGHQGGYGGTHLGGYNGGHQGGYGGPHQGGGYGRVPPVADHHRPGHRIWNFKGIDD